MKILKITMIVLTACFVTTLAHAISSEKVTLKDDMTISYDKLPPIADTIKEAFSEGMVYGRLRSNLIYWDWDEENYKTGGNQKDNRAMGVGGSLIYKSARLKGISSTFGMYTSQNPVFFREDKDDVGYAKTGKDTFSRDEVKKGGDYSGHYGMTVLGQALLQYDVSKTSIFAGRQLFESVFAQSNDTRMVPNTFDGVSAEIKDIPGTKIQLAYFTEQKLRDHIYSHDVIAYDGWKENDDSGVNKSLTKDLIGLDNKLIIASVKNESIKNLNASVGYLIVPDVVSNLMLEAYYKIPIGEWSVTPGARYMMQMDELHADTGVANVSVMTDGYGDPNDLDGKLYAARVDVAREPWMIRLGYSKISDDADIIAPWRGFPTGGFTRAMGQVNWLANTESYMISIDYDFDKAGLIPGFRISTRYVIQDLDDEKPGVPADNDVIQIDLFQKLADSLEMKIRTDLVDGDTGTRDMNGKEKTDISYNEYRLELNYLF